MTDLEITKLCAEAMGLDVTADESGIGGVYFKRSIENPASRIYRPLHNDEQAMALLKRFKLDVAQKVNGHAAAWGDYQIPAVWGENLNRAICEYVASVQAAK